MIVIDKSVIPPWATMTDESENFVMLLASSPVYVDQVEELLSAGLDIRGMTAHGFDHVTICCRKV